jgi:L-amino acid N-acyltransferase YncA
VTIRPGTSQDLPAVYALVALAHAEAPRYRQHQLSAAKIEHLGALTQDHPDFFLYVVEHQAAIIGYIVGAVVEAHFSELRQACSISLFVHPDWRGTRAAYLLLKQLGETGSRLGAREATLSVSSGICVEQTVRLAEALGYVNFGHTLVKQLPCQQ